MFENALDISQIFTRISMFESALDILASIARCLGTHDTNQRPTGGGTRLSHSVNFSQKCYHNMLEGPNVPEGMHMELVAAMRTRARAVAI